MVYPPDLGHIVTTGHKGICNPLSTSSGPEQRSSATLWRGSWPYGPWLPYHTGTQPAVRPAWSQVSGNKIVVIVHMVLTCFKDAFSSSAFVHMAACEKETKLECQMITQKQSKRSVPALETILSHRGSIFEEVLGMRQHHLRDHCGIYSQQRPTAVLEIALLGTNLMVVWGWQWSPANQCTDHVKCPKEQSFSLMKINTKQDNLNKSH